MNMTVTKNQKSYKAYLIIAGLFLSLVAIAALAINIYLFVYIHVNQATTSKNNFDLFSKSGSHSS